MLKYSSPKCDGGVLRGVLTSCGGDESWLPFSSEPVDPNSERGGGDYLLPIVALFLNRLIDSFCSAL